MKKPRILLLSPLPPPIGGIASWSSIFINWCNKNGHEIKIVNTGLIGNRKTNNTKKNFFSESVRMFHIYFSTSRTIKRYKPNILHINSSASPFGLIRDYLCALVGKKKGVSVVVHYHCNIADQIKNNGLGVIYLAKMTKIADFNLVLNKSSENFLLTYSNKPIRLVPNFISIESVLEREKDIADQIKTIVFVGHVVESKGIVDIIIAARAYPDIEFKIAGPIFMNIKFEEVPTNITFLGTLSHIDIIELLRHSDIFLFPSYSEGFSLSLLEAMAQGLPVITTDVGANKDMIENEGGIVVGVKNPKDIIIAINSLFPKQIRKEMSIWNIEKVKEKYLDRKVLGEIYDIYEDIINQDY